MERESNIIWTNFQDHLKLLFQELYRTECYTDVTLVSVDEVEFKAHKIVLSACSPVLKKIIDNNPAEERLIYQTGVDALELDSILHLMYLGDGQFYEERRSEFVRVARQLEIKQISDSTLTWHNFSDHLQLLLQAMYRNEFCSDITLISKDNIEFRAHKIVLSACSPVLKIIIDSKQTETHVMHQTDIASPELESILHFMYVGEGKFYPERIGHFIRVAIDMEINQENKQFAALEEKYFNEENKPKSHRRIYSTNEKTKHNCNECGYQATTRGNLKTHIQSVHEKIKHPCNLCVHQATNQANLKTHIQSVHEKIKYPCNLCVYQATNQANLKRHIKHVHEYGERKYPCNLCDYKASHKGYLTRHIRHAHKKIKYPCNM